jgi:hypothetical protein
MGNTQDFLLFPQSFRADAGTIVDFLFNDLSFLLLIILGIFT